MYLPRFTTTNILWGIFSLRWSVICLRLRRKGSSVDLSSNVRPGSNYDSRGESRFISHALLRLINLTANSLGDVGIMR